MSEGARSRESACCSAEAGSRRAARGASARRGAAGAHVRVEGLSHRYRRGAAIRHRPVDIARVFDATDTTPPARQSPARLSYRLENMTRHAQALGPPLTPKPRFWPADGARAAQVFGSPTYVLDGARFWRQDRLADLDAALAARA